MLKLFCGYDPREAIGFHVFTHSVIGRASKPVEITPLASMGLGEGSNAFTLSRFLVPKLCDFKGHAIFIDACDMLCVADIAELDALFDPQYAVQVVKHPAYKTQHRTKYRGTAMECPNMNYDRKNWMSVAIFNCEHPYWKTIKLDDPVGIHLLQLRGLDDNDIGELPSEWNVLTDEGQESIGAKILHWTSGVPAFKAYRDAPNAEMWLATLHDMNEGLRQ